MAAVRILRGALCWKRQMHINPTMMTTKRTMPMSSSASTLSSLDEEEEHNTIPPKRTVLRSLGKHSSILHHFQRDANFLRRMFEEKRWDSNLEKSLENKSLSIPSLSDGLIVEVLKTLSEARLALRFFIWTIENQKVLPSKIALGVVSRRWCHEKRFDTFMKTLEKTCLHGYEGMDSSAFSVLLMGYGWAGMAEKAIQTLEIMQSLMDKDEKAIQSQEILEVGSSKMSIGTVETMKSSVEKTTQTLEMIQVGPAEQVIEHLEMMRGASPKNNSETQETLEPVTRTAEKVIHTQEMGERGRIQVQLPEASHFLIVLDILEREKLFDPIPAIYAKMVEAGFFPNQETYKKLISGLCIAGHKKEAWKLLHDMKATGLRPEPETYRIVLSMFSKANKVVEVLKLFNEILEDGIEPDAKACNALVKAFCLDQKFKEGLEVVEMMLGRELNPNLVSLNMVVEGLFNSGELDEVFALWEKLNDNLVPTLTFHHRLVIELSKAGKLAKAELVLQDIKKKSSTLPEDVSAAFVDGLSKMESIEKVQKDELGVFAKAQKDVGEMDDGLSKVSSFEKAQKLVIKMDGGLSEVFVFEKAQKNVVCIDDEQSKAISFAKAQKDVVDIDDGVSKVNSFAKAEKDAIETEESVS